MGGKTLQAFDPSKSSILELTDMGQEYRQRGVVGWGGRSR